MKKLTVRKPRPYYIGDDSQVAYATEQYFTNPKPIRSN